MAGQMRKPRRDQQAPTAGSTSRQPKIRVIPGPEVVTPSEGHLPKIRVIGDDRLTTEEWRRRFAFNLDRLIDLLGMTRKQAASEIGISYKLVRRLVSAGVSRTDERSEEDLAKIASFFALSGVDDLWRGGLIPFLLDPERSRGFIEKFRPRLLAERESRLGELRLEVEDELTLLNRALGFADKPQRSLAGPHADQVAAILASPRAESFKQVIAAYHELVTLLPSARAEGGTPSRRDPLELHPQRANEWPEA